MLDTNNERVRSLLLRGGIGLEKESLRITPEGFLAQTKHPFGDDKYIVRDFCENQTEINTVVSDSVDAAMKQLSEHTKRIVMTLAELPEPEYLWPFSNPPYIRRESEIPIATYEGEEKEKEEYRYYLAERYGRYKMTFSGIHFNYSFADALLRADMEAKGETDFRAYKDRFYISLAAKAQLYNWLIVAVTAASPLLDSSYVEKGVLGKDVFNGMGTTRCSELGYWNMFTPILDYTDVNWYVGSILAYIDEGLIHSSAELYYPVRLKPPGTYHIRDLKEKGISHIELRMIDLNPLTPWGIDPRDVLFIKLLLIWLASQPEITVNAREQVFAIQNTKTAAHYDLKTVSIIMPDHRTLWAADAACEVLSDMKAYFKQVEDQCDRIMDTLDYQIAKFSDADKRYAWQVRKRFGDGFVEKGLALCRDRLSEIQNGEWDDKAYVHCNYRCGNGADCRFGDPGKI